MRRRRKAQVTVDRKKEQTQNQIIDIISSNNSIVVNHGVIDVGSSEEAIPSGIDATMAS